MLSAYEVYQRQEREGERKKMEEQRKKLMLTKKYGSDSLFTNKRKKRKLQKSLSDGVLIKQKRKQTNDESPLIQKPLKRKRVLLKDNSSLDEEEEEREADTVSDTEDSSQTTNNSVTTPSVVFDKPFKEWFDPDGFSDSRSAGTALFELLIKPYPVEKFYNNVWEKKPVLLSRKCPTYNEGWFSSKELDTIIHQNYIEYGVNLNVTMYYNGKKVTENPTGRVYSSTIWDYFNDGYSIQFLNPQSYSKTMWLLGATLQEHFSSFVGANIYLTPAGTQGFAPHYDDIEAFVMQIEGRKRWRLYKPRNHYEILPRVSSRDFDEDEIGQPILDAILEPGDLLYFPRGVIHQAIALPDDHSLHITLSTHQKNTWGDLLEKMIPAALKIAIQEDEELRKSLPWDYTDYIGTCHGNENDPRAKAFLNKLCDLSLRAIQYAPMESATDQYSLEEKDSSIFNQGGTRLSDEGQLEIESGPKITLHSKVKLIRSKAVRLVREDDIGYVLYYTTNNTLIYHEKDPQGLTIEEMDVAAVQYIVDKYPNYVTVSELPLEKDEDKTSLCVILYERGLLLLQR